MVQRVLVETATGWALGAVLLLCLAAPSQAEPRNGKGGGSAGGKVAAECSDHVDNDGDGFCDYAWKRGYCSDGSQLGDPDCASKDGSEACQPSTEICDGLDNDCDDTVDEGGVCTVPYYCDGDRDGYVASEPSGTCSEPNCVPPGCSSTPGADCDDTAAEISPAVFENCDGDGVDGDCDATIDECDPCSDGTRNGGETDVDCGGACPGCDLGGSCTADSDCLSGNCDTGACAESPTNLDPLCRVVKYDNGTTQNHVNLVLVPSAFGGDMDLFRQKAEWIASTFANYEPFDQTISRYNVLYVAKDEGDYCYFNCSGIARLLCCDTALARNLSSICTTGPRQTVVVHNSETYGGAGYPSADVATTSVHSSAPRVAVHELGHSLFNLADEYDYVGATPAYPNCDYQGCAKWQELVGYQGVGCQSGACSGGAYYTGESSIMRSLGYPFEEVNLRLSCCVHGVETGEYPAYCDQFAQLTPGGNLDDFCQGSATSGAAAVPSDYLDDPEEITFIRDGRGEWQLEQTTARRPGFYPLVQTRGQGTGRIKVAVGFANGRKRLLRFEEVEDVEFPGVGVERLGGYVSLPRSVITLVVDKRGRGDVISAQARSD